MAKEKNNIEAPKKKRGRPSKAELAARAAVAEAVAQETTAQDVAAVSKPIAAVTLQESQVNESPIDEVTNEVAPVEETTKEVAPAEENPVEEMATEMPAEPSRKRRTRRTREEIMAAAEAKAAEMAANREAEIAKEEENTAIPEAIFGVGEEQSDAMDPEMGLMERLQSKVELHNSETFDDQIWEDAPDDDTDFIIVNDIPVEDNAVIPYYDMLDNANTAEEPTFDYGLGDEGNDDSDEDGSGDEDFDFSDIVKTIGLLEIMPDGYGFLRSSDFNYLASPDDVHITVQQIRQNSLKTGDVVECFVRPPHGNERYFTLSKLIKVNGREPGDIRDRISFENLTPLFPDEKFDLTGDPKTTNISTRIVDLFAPIGKGQRSLIVSQPKTGKTILMKDIANAIAANHPEAYIMMLLIDERPEEVTDMARTVNAEVIASTFDEPADRHVKIAGLVLEKAKRLVECGHDVVIFLDSITRLARAYNTVAPASGKVLTGGVDANALQKPKRFFGAARNIENGGSLTIIATALTDTGSKMDEVIFEEFKGTGNSELQLDRQLSNKRIFPSVNLVASSTRRDDLLLDKQTIDKMWILRKSISDMNAVEAMNTIHNLMGRTRNNDEFFMAMNS